MHLFYQELLRDGHFQLENEEHHHCISVLRHKVGDKIYVTDGNGCMAECVIRKTDRKSLNFEILDQTINIQKPFVSRIAIAPTKQMERMEWFVEKACELGVDAIHFLIAKNAERPTLKLDRLEKKAISALKQSKGSFRTKLHPLTRLGEFFETHPSEARFIASVDPKNEYIASYLSSGKSTTILIGPEGDFTKKELDLSVQNGCIAVSLGSRILRTETAGIVAAQFINSANSY